MFVKNGIELLSKLKEITKPHGKNSSRIFDTHPRSKLVLKKADVDACGKVT